MADNKKGILICNLALGFAGACFYTAWIAPRFHLPTALWARFLAFCFFCGTVTTMGMLDLEMKS